MVMRGRKKKANAKRRVIRITDKASYGLFKLKKDLHLPYYYKENEIIQALLIEIEYITSTLPQYITRQNITSRRL